MYTFTPPLSLTVYYDEALLPAGMSEGTLQVYRWDEVAGDWQALTVLGRDTDADAITVALDHLTDFALLGPEERRLYLPLVLRRFQ